jgi:hypothetical protein
MARDTLSTQVDTPGEKAENERSRGVAAHDPPGRLTRPIRQHRKEGPVLSILAHAPGSKWSAPPREVG